MRLEPIAASNSMSGESPKVRVEALVAVLVNSAGQATSTRSTEEPYDQPLVNRDLRLRLGCWRSSGSMRPRCHGQYGQHQRRTTHSGLSCCYSVDKPKQEQELFDDEEGTRRDSICRNN